MLDQIQNAIAEVQQARSNFQLTRFVIGQHPTPEMQYYQICLELQDMIYKYKMAQLAEKKSILKIEKLRSSKDPIDEIKAQEIELGMEHTAYAMAGAKRELDELIALWDAFEHKYTRAEIEAAQPEYWQARLTNNAKAMLMSGNPVNAAHIEAMEQAGVLDGFVEEVEKQKKELA